MEYGMTIRPIRTEGDHAAAPREIDRLWGAAAPDTPDGATLEVLLTLVDAYEDAAHPIPPSDPINAVLFVMEQRGLTRRDVEPMIGSRARVAEVLNRKRALTLPMIRRLAEGLGIPAEILVRDYSVDHAA